VEALEMAERCNEDWVHILASDGSPEQQHAFEALSHHLFRVAWGYLARQERTELAEDCVQDALVIIFRDLARFRGESRFVTYATGITLNKCREELRKRKHEAPTDFSLVYEGEEVSLLEALEDLEPCDPELLTERRELVEVMNEIISQALSIRQQIVLVNIDLLDGKANDVAEQLGTNRNNVYKILHDARKKLKRELENRGYSQSYVRRLLS
jgi:RNA polymerase sigma-70 factor (ECF subfamily)